MREIKYRMWNKKEKKMYQVGVLDFDDEKAYMKNYLSYIVSNYMFEDIELMQFTGLHDKNGKEIYEGDIVAEKGHYVNSDRILYQDIKWKESYSCWLRGEYQRLTPKNIERYEIEVVGNIYDNPELLKGADNIE